VLHVDGLDGHSAIRVAEQGLHGSRPEVVTVDWRSDVDGQREAIAEREMHEASARADAVAVRVVARAFDEREGDGLLHLGGVGLRQSDGLHLVMQELLPRGHLHVRRDGLDERGGARRV
jgi:hypothetical protein